MVCAGRDDAEIARRAAAIGREVDELRSNSPLAGTPAEIADKLGAYIEVGVQRVYLQLLDMSDLDHLEFFATRGGIAVRLTGVWLRPAATITGHGRSGPDDHDDEQLSSATPWYNRTPALVGASVAGLAVIGILIAAVTFVSRQFNEPDQAPLNFVEPSFSATATHSLSTPTTTATITSTSPRSPPTSTHHRPPPPRHPIHRAVRDTSTPTRTRRPGRTRQQAAPNRRPVRRVAAPARM